MTSTTQPLRLDSGGQIDRGRELAFSFDGRGHHGYAGDTLAAALLANGVRLIGRSFKYHRPRGVFGAGREEPNALVELRTGAYREPNTKATTVELFDGLEAASQNRWPSLRFDLLAVNSLLTPFLAAGFYYKTFMWPSAWWEKVYEPLIRRSAGLGRAADAAEPDRYEKAHGFCDILVIGGGPAGLMAALTAAGTGARVILCEEDFALGGRLLAERLEIDGMPGAAWAASAEAELAANPDVCIMRRTAVFGVYDSGVYGAIERVSDHLPAAPRHVPRQRMWKIVARRAVLAAGAIERPIVFGGNDRPGVMLASAVRAYLHRFAVAPGRRIAVFTAGDDGWTTALDLAAAGVAVAAVIDPRAQVSDQLEARARRVGARVFIGAKVVAARGRQSLHAIDVLAADGHSAAIAVDCLAISGGWNPTIGLTCHQGGRPRWSEETKAYLPGTPPHGMIVAGAASGELSLAAAVASGARAGAAVASALGFAAARKKLPHTSDDRNDNSGFWYVRESRAKAFVDLQNDVTDKDIALAHQEGFRSVEHLKRYTTLGMGTDQGKTSNLAGFAIMADLTGRTVGDVGSTSFRPPQDPVAIGAFAGPHRDKHFRPVRMSPSHAWAVEQGAVFVETGLWLRAEYYPRPGDADRFATIVREVMTVRRAVGVCDVSTFGKIDIQGSDAGPFLDRVYINTLSTLAIGRTRYGMMLREDGMAMDDGTVARLGPEHYVITTTTANAGPVMQHLEFCRQVLWPDLDLQLASISEQWAQYSIAGPCARSVLAKLTDPPFDISNETLPYLGAAEVTIGGGSLAARLFRVSFSGELAYELAVPARYGDAVIRMIMAAGAEFGIAPYGTEALGVMRIEKGHAAGNEIGGHATPRDLGLGRMMSTKKEYIGREMAARPALLDPARPSLVGLRPVDPAHRLAAGAHLLAVGAAPTAANDEGFISSATYSPSLGHWIGLGFLTRGPERLGETLRAYDPVRGGDTPIVVCSPVFIDPEGVRLRV